MDISFHKILVSKCSQHLKLLVGLLNAGFQLLSSPVISLHTQACPLLTTMHTHGPCTAG